MLIVKVDCYKVLDVYHTNVTDINKIFTKLFHLDSDVRKRYSKLLDEYDLDHIPMIEIWNISEIIKLHMHVQYRIIKKTNLTPRYFIISSKIKSTYMMIILNSNIGGYKICQIHYREYVYMNPIGTLSNSICNVCDCDVNCKICDPNECTQINDYYAYYDINNIKNLDSIKTIGIKHILNFVNVTCFAL